MENFQNLSVGDKITFGQYPQGKDRNEKSPIEWRILDIRQIEGSKQALLLSEKGLDCKRYNKTEENITWEKCSLRQWLNEKFLKLAFASEEQSRIVLADVPADKNPEDDTDPGNPTKDKVFLLSYPEAERYFKDDDDRICCATAYAKKRGAYTAAKDDCCWWLRSPGCFQISAACMHNDGSFSGTDVDYVNGAVRPALWINL